MEIPRDSAGAIGRGEFRCYSLRAWLAVTSNLLLPVTTQDEVDAEYCRKFVLAMDQVASRYPDVPGLSRVDGERSSGESSGHDDLETPLPEGDATPPAPVLDAAQLPLPPLPAAATSGPFSPLDLFTELADMVGARRRAGHSRWKVALMPSIHWCSLPQDFEELLGSSDLDLDLDLDLDSTAVGCEQESDFLPSAVAAAGQEGSRRRAAAAAAAGPSPHVLQLDDLSPYFHLPQPEAARALGITATALKRLCRQQGLKRWPYREARRIELRAAGAPKRCPRGNLDRSLATYPAPLNKRRSSTRRPA